jgi:hypothetical protein
MFRRISLSPIDNQMKPLPPPQNTKFETEGNRFGHATDRRTQQPETQLRRNFKNRWHLSSAISGHATIGACRRVFKYQAWAVAQATGDELPVEVPSVVGTNHAKMAQKHCLKWPNIFVEIGPRPVLWSTPAQWESART